MKKKLFISIVLLFILLTNSILLPVHASNKVKVENNHTELTLEITYANYLDADGDGIEDDVITLFSTDIETALSLVYFGLEVVLTLPSGNYFEYYFLIITNEANLDFTLLLYDTATEPGWYLIAITAILYQGEYAEGTAYYVFDPPGDEGGDPV